MISSFVILLCLLAPAFWIAVCVRFPSFDRFGLVLLCFASGIFASNLQLIAPEALSIEARPAQIMVTEISIALAIPLLLFSMNPLKALSLAGQSIASFILAVISVTLIAFSMAFVYANTITEIPEVAAMAVGAYTGGGANMAAIKTAIQAEDDIFILMTAYDMALSAIYLLFMLSAGKFVFRRLLKPFPEEKRQTGEEHFVDQSNESATTYLELKKSKHLKNTGKALAFATLCVGFGVVTGSFLPEGIASMAIIILITSSALFLSLIPAVHKLTTSFRSGMYLCLVFSFTMGSLVEIEQLININWPIFIFTASVITCSVLLHFCLAKLFQVDADTFMLTSTAAIMSVPFIPLVAAKLNNQKLLVPSFAVAILGYVLGNYLGIGTAIALRYLLIQ